MELAIDGMTCDGCARAIERVVKKVAGVATVEVSFERKRLVVGGTPERAAIVAAIERAGYQVR